ncbi:hypothetical protein [Roseateles sp.]|uniref:hypothetical protein n=1 Tax=Roseateles sp. TaxID=1971397 RepID=UPI003BAADD5B
MAAGAADGAEPPCDLCEDLKLLVDVMEGTVRQHTSARNPQLLLALSEKLGAKCRDHETLQVVVCEASMPRTGELWTLEVRPNDDLAGQQPHRLSLAVKFAVPRAEGIGEFRERALAGWKPQYLDACQHSVWKPGPVPQTLSMAYVSGDWQSGACSHRVEHIDLYVFSSSLPFPAPRVH